VRISETPPTVATVLDPADRYRVDAAAGGRFATVHANSVADAIRTVRERPVEAVLLSAGYVPPDHVPAVANLVRTFPAVRAVAVVSQHNVRSSERLLELGASGVRSVVDLSQRDGWRSLRALLTHPASPISATILARVMPELADAPPDCRFCFETLIRLAPGVVTIRALCRHYHVRPSTFVSRFFRAGLPSPKRYLALLRLVYVAALLETRGLSVADAAHRLEYSSPQGFGRHLRTVTGLSAVEFRRTMTFARALDEFAERLIVPYRTALRAFHPLETQGTSAPGQHVGSPGGNDAVRQPGRAGGRAKPRRNRRR
jgi:AraC-like DNA-binding protein